MTGLAAIRKWLPRWGWAMTVLLLWAALGAIGHALIAWSWRTAQVREFERTVQAVAYLAGQQSWKQPWESDPKWQEIEQQLDVDLVPLIDGQAHQVTWMKTPGGDWRASVTVPVANASTGTAFIRGTRIYDDHGIDRVWWLTWSALNSILLCAIWFIRRRQRKQLAIQRESQALWQATHAKADESAALARARQQLANVMDNLREGVMSLDANLRIEMINKNLCEQLELGGSQNLVGRRLLEVVRVPAVVDMVDHSARSLSATEQTIEVGTAARYLHILVVPIQAGDEPLRLLVTATDVSSAQRSELARREFITGASHELKTPLAAIRAYTETLQSIGQEDPETTERFLEKILDQADRMDRLVNSMLQLARAESGNLKLKVQPIDAVLAIKHCLEAAAGMAQTKGLQFECHLPEQRMMVMADRDALQTIASNLLSNAVRYTPGGGKVLLDLWEDADSNESRWVCLRVSDTGIGIALADQPRIFERFYRVQKDRAVDSGGTGLGLAIVKQLTQVLGGSVQVISHPGVGTRFEIRLPAVGFTQSSSNAGGQAEVSTR